MKDKRYDEAIEKIKGKLHDYLNEHGVSNPEQLFSCINPDHDDRNPSCNAQNGLTFHCYSCGFKGDIFTATNIFEGRALTGKEWLHENVKYLADKYEVEIHIDDLTPDDLYKIETYKAYKVAATYIADKSIGDYTLFDKEMEAREWDQEIIEGLLIGTVNFLEYKEHLKAAGFKIKFLQEVDLLRKELFNSDHMVFTVCDEIGRPVGFAARNLTYDENAKQKGTKYVNQKTTGVKCNIYEKGKRLYNLHNALKVSPPLYIVEGYADAVTAIHKGINNVAAIGGTAFTPDHITTLKERNQYDIVLCFDGDTPGQNKIEKLLDEKFSGNKDMKVRIVTIPDELDPDEFLRTRGEKEFISLKKFDSFAWRLERFDELEMDPQDICVQMIPLILNEPSHVKKESMVDLLSSYTGASVRSIEGELKRLDVTKERESQEQRETILEELQRSLRRSPSDAPNLLSIALSKMEDVDKIYNLDNFSKECWVKTIAASKEEEEDETREEPGFNLNRFKNLEEVLRGQWKKDVLMCIGGVENTGKCQKFDAPVLLADGTYRSIEQVVKDKIKYGIKMKDHKLVAAEFTDWIDSGELECFNVKTKHGLETEPSETHPYYTLDGWKQVKDLNVGDRIAITKNYNCFNNIDSKLGVSKGVLLGLFLADGSITEKIGFSNIDPELIELFKDCCSHEWTGLKFRRDINTCTYVSDSKKSKSNNVSDWLKKEGIMGLNSHTKFIPDSIFKSGPKTVSAFLGAFYACDGWVYVGAGKQEIGLTLCNKHMLTQIRHLLLRFGICTRIISSTSSYISSTKRFNRYTLTIADLDGIRKFNNAIKIPLKHKQKKIEDILLSACNKEYKKGSYNSNFPTELWSHIKKSAKNKGFSMTKLLSLATGESLMFEKTRGTHTARFRFQPKNRSRKNAGISPALFRTIAYLLNDQFLISLAEGDIYFDVITEIKPIGKHHCYDLTVEGEHNFVINDTIVHNTALMANIAYDLATSNDDICVIFHTIDDTISQFLPRLVCISANETDLEINHVVNPVHYAQAHHRGYRNRGYEEIMELGNRGDLIVKDASSGTTLSYGEGLIKYYKEKYPNKQIVYFMDNFHKLSDLQEEKDERIRFKYLSNYIKNQIAVKYHIPVIATVEYTKLEPNARPNNHNISETVAISYDANFIGHTYNEMHGRGFNAQIYHSANINGETVTLPRIELIVGKNKITSFKDSLFFNFFPASSLMVPCDAKHARQEAKDASGGGYSYNPDANKSSAVTQLRD